MRRPSKYSWFVAPLAVAFVCVSIAPGQDGELLDLDAADTDVTTREVPLAVPEAGGGAASGLSAGELAAASQLADHISTSEWLGPMAPVALSPFFGIACLSGMAIWGHDLIPGGNAFLSEASPLHNPAMFWTFLTLTVLTSLPRFTKISKPIAQALDHVEAYAGIITLLLVRIMAEPAADAAEQQVVIYQAGVFTVTADLLLSLAMIVNVIVIHAVRFFFEFLVWITPIPLLDACFEVANKSVCAGLMALYAYSPTIATGVNLLIFVACLLVFEWVHRRSVFCRTMALDPLLRLLFARRGIPRQPELTVFPAGGFGPFAARARCMLTADNDGWQLIQRRLFRAPLEMRLRTAECRTRIRPGLFTNAIVFDGPATKPCTFSRRYNGHLPELARILGAEIEVAATSDQPQQSMEIKAEFA